MSFHSWLQNLRSALATGRGQRHDRQRGALRAATHRPKLEVLEDRSLLSFSPATSFPVGTNPQAVATADFNNDGRLDLATADSGGNAVSVLLGDGQGGFGAASHFAAGSSPHSLVVSDFNNDGRLDLAAANDNSTGYGGDVSILLGNGDGTFRPPVSAGGWFGEALSLAPADFNADGNMDLAYTFLDITDWDAGYVQVLLGDGLGGFTFGEYQDVNSSAPVGMAVADLNADGKGDVVTANEDTDTVSVLLGNGDGTLSYDYWSSSSNFATGPSPRAVAVGDFTGDGIPDLVVAGQIVDVLPGHGDGTFASPIPHSANGSAHTAVATGDFNGDGKLDVVTSDGDAGSVSALLGNGDGTLSYVGAFATGSSPAAVAVGDFNGDGKADAMSANSKSNTVSVLLNDGIWDVLPLPPCVSGKTVTVNGGAFQRSRVTSVTIDFDQVVNLPINPANAFQLKRQSDNALVALTANVVNDSVTHVTLTFAGALSQFGSLEDGRYTITVFASKVSNANGKLDGDCNGIGGDDFVLASTETTGVFRLFGDSNGDATVNSTDFASFRTVFGLGASIFDFYNDGQTNAADFAQFRNRFGLGLP